MSKSGVKITPPVLKKIPDVKIFFGVNNEVIVYVDFFLHQFNTSVLTPKNYTSDTAWC